eukprot:GEMP01002289.1.p1 GENE.GEMP01002289.1~~GEMP01002289.1.p1  ORF type:complete len:1336 (+),score=370.08 GEMP01002289.1:206-4213(+)
MARNSDGDAMGNGGPAWPQSNDIPGSPANAMRETLVSHGSPVNYSMPKLRVSFHPGVRASGDTRADESLYTTDASGASRLSRARKQRGSWRSSRTSGASGPVVLSDAFKEEIPLFPVRARWLAGWGDEMMLAPCRTIGDARARFANLHRRFAVEVLLFDIDHRLLVEDNEPPPPMVYVKARKVEMIDTRWSRALALHAMAKDEVGLWRIMAAIDKQSRGEAFFKKSPQTLAEFEQRRVEQISVEEEYALLRQTAPNERDPRSRLLAGRALLYVIKTCSDDIPCDMLIDCHADIEYEGALGVTPLMWATYLDREEQFAAVFEANADLNHTDEYGQTVLFWATKEAYLDVFQFLLENRADPSITNANGSTVLFWACTAGRTDVAFEMMRYNADPSHKDTHGYTPGYWAAYGGFPDVVKLLFHAKANMITDAEDGTTPLHAACHIGHPDIVAMLLRNGKDFNTRDLKSAKVFDAPREAAREVNRADQNGWAPLHFATCLGPTARHTEIVTILLYARAKVTTPDVQWCVPLHFAAARGSDEACSILLDAKCPVDPLDRCNRSPFFLAAKRFHRAAMEVLFKAGAFVDQADVNGLTPLMHIAKFGTVEVLERVLDALADVNAQNNDGERALQHAVWHARTDLAASLIRYGADFDFWSNHGWIRTDPYIVTTDNPAGRRLNGWKQVPTPSPPGPVRSSKNLPLFQPYILTPRQPGDAPLASPRGVSKSSVVSMPGLIDEAAQLDEHTGEKDMQNADAGSPDTADVATATTEDKKMQLSKGRQARGKPDAEFHPLFPIDATYQDMFRNTNADKLKLSWDLECSKAFICVLSGEYTLSLDQKRQLQEQLKKWHLVDREHISRYGLLWQQRIADSRLRRLENENVETEAYYWRGTAEDHAQTRKLREMKLNTAEVVLHAPYRHDKNAIYPYGVPKPNVLAHKNYMAGDRPVNAYMSPRTSPHTPPAGARYQWTHMPPGSPPKGMRTPRDEREYPGPPLGRGMVAQGKHHSFRDRTVPMQESEIRKNFWEPVPLPQTRRAIEEDQRAAMHQQYASGALRGQQGEDILGHKMRGDTSGKPLARERKSWDTADDLVPEDPRTQPLIMQSDTRLMQVHGEPPPDDSPRAKKIQRHEMDRSSFTRNIRQEQERGKYLAFENDSDEDSGFYESIEYSAMPSSYAAFPADNSHLGESETTQAGQAPVAAGDAPSSAWSSVPPSMSASGSQRFAHPPHSSGEVARDEKGKSGKKEKDGQMWKKGKMGKKGDDKKGKGIEATNLTLSDAAAQSSAALSASYSYDGSSAMMSGTSYEDDAYDGSSAMMSGTPYEDDAYKRSSAMMSRTPYATDA